ncbi:unnamed protein product [Lactuca virosa]|uniref:Uncharacterized protein n=1 Tax=Lactuca virosa TaxID=75947 RepID=A0AAU9LSD8_9ASTR|nr:unnamed protein product [Lactuca virosa]
MSLTAQSYGHWIRIWSESSDWLMQARHKVDHENEWATATATGGGGSGVEVAVRWLNRRNTNSAWLIEGGRKRGVAAKPLPAVCGSEAAPATLGCPFFGPTAKAKGEGETSSNCDDFRGGVIFVVSIDRE